MSDWQAEATEFFVAKTNDLWVWFDSLNREEWLIVLASCCALGFLFMKSWGRRGPC